MADMGDGRREWALIGGCGLLSEVGRRMAARVCAWPPGVADEVLVSLMRSRGWPGPCARIRALVGGSGSHRRLWNVVSVTSAVIVAVGRMSGCG